MKKGWVALLLSLIILNGCSTSSGTLPEPKATTTNNGEDPEEVMTETEKDASHSDQNSSGEKTGETDESKKQESEPVVSKNITKYYVDSVFRIKPVDEADPNKVAFLTFDDAPYGDTTYHILDLLDQYDAKALFFINGHLAESRKEVVKEIAERGHLIGNHTWWHKNLRKMTLEQAREEISSVSELIEEITGGPPVYFRPPFGQNSDQSLAIVKELGMQSMNWSVGSEDWVYPKPEQASKVVESTMKQMHPGANILFHDKAVTVIALEDIMKQLSEQGYQFVLPTEVIIKD
jgi:peptidoglycan/xylan/chitin deacetylase (PgdA/CDA1 family)